MVFVYILRNSQQKKWVLMFVKHHLGWWNSPEGMLTVTKDCNHVTDIWNNLTDANAEKVLISVEPDAIKQKGKGSTDTHCFLIDIAAFTRVQVNNSDTFIHVHRAKKLSKCMTDCERQVPHCLGGHLQMSKERWLKLIHMVRVRNINISSFLV